MGEGGGGEEKGRPDTKPFSKSCDTSKIWMWQWLDNTQYPLTSPTARAIGKEKPLKFFIDVLISCYRYVILLWTETQRGIQKGSRGRSQVLSWNKNKTRARIVFWRPRSLKERCTRSMEKPLIPASAETMSEYWFHKTGTKKRISVFQICKCWFNVNLIFLRHWRMQCFPFCMWHQRQLLQYSWIVLLHL